MHRELVTVVGEDGRVVCARCVVADSARLRMRGLLGRRGLAQHEGILLQPTSSVHTFFMRFPIDVVFVDRDLVVTRVVHGLRRWRVTHARGARAALELPAGAAARAAIREGEQLALDRVRKRSTVLRALGRAVARTSTIVAVAVLAFTASALVGPAETANTQAPRPPEVAFRTSIATMAALAQPDTPLRVVVPQIAPSALRTALDVLRVTKHMPSREAYGALSRSDAKQVLRVAKLLNVEWSELVASIRADSAEERARLARWYRTVGIETLVRGFASAGPRLAAQVLQDPRIDIYLGGRIDIGAGRIDTRVLATIAYLAETYGQVSVSSLVSGHPLYSRPGVVSAHIPGRAVDIARLGGLSILGNQYPGGITESAVAELLRAPGAIYPAQIISLLDLGGSSFALDDHHDHIHIGYTP